MLFFSRACNAVSMMLEADPTKNLVVSLLLMGMCSNSVIKQLANISKYIDAYNTDLFDHVEVIW